jgi:hypothetical protein
LAEALYQLNLARDEIRKKHVRHPEAALYALSQAELNIGHVIGCITEQVPS